MNLNIKKEKVLKYKRLYILIFVLGIFAILELGISFYNNSKLIRYDYKNSEILKYSIQDVEKVNWHSKENGNLISDIDPMLIINNLKAFIKDIKIEVTANKIIPYIQIFYTVNEGGGFNEDKSIRINNKQDKNYFDTELGKGIINLRIDLGDDADLELYNIDILINTHLSYFNINRYLNIILLLIIIWMIVIFFKKDFIDKWFIKYIVMGISVVLFFLIYPIFSVDSVWYYSYLDFFNGIKPLNQWPAIRGFVFPGILWLSTKISLSSWGLNLTFCIFYIIFLFYLMKLLDLFITYINNDKIILCKLKYILLLFLILLNPIIYGYFHMVLTEFVTAVFLVIFAYYELKFFIYRIEKENIEISYLIKFTILSSIMIILSWFLKQMYFTIILFVFIAFEILFLIKKWSIQNLIFSLSIGSVMVISLFFSINWFSSVTLQESGFSASSTITGGLRYFEKSKEELGIPVLVNIKDDNENIIDNFEYTFENTLGNKIKYLWTCFLKEPKRFLIGYFDNYMLLCNLYERPYEQEKIRYGNGPVNRGGILDIFNNVTNRTGTFNISGENRKLIIGNLQYNYDCGAYIQSIKDMMIKEYKYNEQVEVYQHVNKAGKFIRIITNRFFVNFTIILYAFLTFFSLPIALINFILFYKTRENSRLYIYGINFALTIFAFLHILMLTITGSVIDRYAFPAYVALLIVFINHMCIFFNTLLKIRENRKLKKIENFV